MIQVAQGLSKFSEIGLGLFRFFKAFTCFSCFASIGRLVQVETCWARFVRIGASLAKFGNPVDSLTKGLATKRLRCVSVCFSYYNFFKLVHVCRNKDRFG